MDYLLIVDENNNFIREEEKEKCHQGKGILHRAFLVMVFNKELKLMLAKRSDNKKLWPNYWDGTVASHFHYGDSPKEAPRKRVTQEIGIKCKKVEYLFNFRYHAEYKNIGSEKEICAVFLARNICDKDIPLNKREVLEYRYISIPELIEEVEARPHIFTPWFLLTYKKILNRSPIQKLVQPNI